MQLSFCHIPGAWITAASAQGNSGSWNSSQPVVGYPEIIFSHICCIATLYTPVCHYALPRYTPHPMPFQFYKFCPFFNNSNSSVTSENCRVNKDKGGFKSMYVIGNAGNCECYALASDRLCVLQVLGMSWDTFTLNDIQVT